MTENLLDRVVARLSESTKGGPEVGWFRKEPCGTSLPSRREVLEIVENLREVLFPGYFGNSELTHESLGYHIGAVLAEVDRRLREQVKRGICFTCSGHNACVDCDGESRRIVSSFLEELPEIRRLLLLDVQAAYEGDPAATHPDEAVFCYPGLHAITNHRLAHALHREGVPLLPRMISEQAHSATGIDIHPGATIGECFFIDHGTGVVIGETARIGKRVRIYQGVTLGARSFPRDESGRPIKGIERHPVVEDEVVIYSGATILGRITIGQGAVIGGNVWVTTDVPPRSRVVQTPSKCELFDHGAGI